MLTQGPDAENCVDSRLTCVYAQGQKRFRKIYKAACELDSAL